MKKLHYNDVATIIVVKTFKFQDYNLKSSKLYFFLILFDISLLIKKFNPQEKGKKRTDEVAKAPEM